MKYNILINNQELETNTVYFERENDIYLHHKGHTKPSHTNLDEIAIMINSKQCANDQ